MKKLLQRTIIFLMLFFGAAGINEAFGIACVFMYTTCGFEVTRAGCGKYSCGECNSFWRNCCRQESGPCWIWGEGEGYFQYCHENCMSL